MQDLDPHTTSETKPDDSRLSRRIRISIILLILAMLAILIVGYMTFSNYVDFVK